MDIKNIGIVALASLPVLAVAQERSRVVDEVIVEATRYSTPQTAIATKTDTALRDVPQSVTVITSDLIRDQSMRSMADVARYVPGLRWARARAIAMRRLCAATARTADFFVDGVRDDVQYFRDLYNAERIEVLKGPNAMIFGRGGGGGVINRVTKAADGRHHGEVASRGGAMTTSVSLRTSARPSTDVLALRLNAMYEDSESYRDFVELERYGVNPTMALALSDEHVVCAQLRALQRRSHGRPRRALPHTAVRSTSSTSTFFGNPDLSLAEATVDLLPASLEHDFSDDVDSCAITRVFARLRQVLSERVSRTRRSTRPAT